MANENFRNALDAQLANITLSPNTKAAIRHKVYADTQSRQPKVKRMPFKRLASVCLAAALLCTFGITAVASVVPGFSNLMQIIGNNSSFLQPVNMANEAEGIRLEVVAAIRDGYTTYVYITLQDTQQQGLIAENTQLADITIGDESYVFSEMLSFNSETATATYRLQYHAFTDDSQNSKISLSIGTILLGGQTVAEYDTGYTLADIEAANPAPQTQTQELSSYTIYWGNEQSATAIEEAYNNNLVPMLDKENTQAYNLPAWLPVSSMGVIDSWLHVQVQSNTQTDLYNLVDFYLSAPGIDSNNLTVANSQMEPVNQNETGDVQLYGLQEWVLEIPNGVPASEVGLYATGTFYEQCLQGGWHAEFTLETSMDMLEWDCNLQIESTSINKVKLSPIGVVVLGKSNDNNNYDIDIAVLLQDGTWVESNSSSITMHANGRFEMKIDFTNLVNPADVQAVYINGVELTAAKAKTLQADSAPPA